MWLDNELVVRDTKLAEGADPYDPSSYSIFTQKYYSPDLMFEEINNFVDENKSNPFFLYWATTIPHVSLQAPEKWVQKYVEKFGDEEPYLGERGYLPNRYPHAAYAAMVSYLDDQVGQLVNKLKQLGLYENTVFFFTSDNGPTYAGGADSSYFVSAEPFTTTSDRIKGSVYEGGIRSPLVACWSGRIKPGSVSEHISVFYDVLPTLCEIAGCPAPGDIDGISFVPELLGRNGQSQHDFLYWEFPERGGQQAVRMGEWKGIRRDLQKGMSDIELFNLSEDIGEQNNVAKQRPEIVKKIEQIMKQEHKTPSLDAFKIKSLGDV